MSKIAFSFVFLLTISSPATAGEFDAHVKACHDAVWALKDYEDIPNAGVSAYIGGYDDNSFYSYWIVDWDDVQVAGKCLMDLKTPKIKSIKTFGK